MTAQDGLNTFSYSLAFDFTKSTPTITSQYSGIQPSLESLQIHKGMIKKK